MAIEADLEASPWEGEGHRKVWARLRVCRGIRVSRKRVLRVMRENNLLSPHRCRRRGGNPHVGEIITHAPNLMWGTDGVRGRQDLIAALSKETVDRADLRRCGAGAGLETLRQRKLETVDNTLSQRMLTALADALKPTS